MKRNLRSVIVGTTVLAITGGVLAATVGTAAASTPTWEPDPHALGTLSFYNSAGVQITGGSNTAHLFDYALASSNDPSAHPGNIANLEFANPQVGQDPGLWPASADEASNYPNSSAPSPLKTSTHPLVTLDAEGANLQAAAGGFTPNTAAGYANVYQIRLYTTGAGGTGTGGSSYWDADVQVSGSGASATWTEVYGTPISTATVLGSSLNPSNQGTSVTFTATETAGDGTHPAGTTQFSIGGTNVGSPVTDSAAGVATFVDSSLTSAGSPYSVQAVFTPTAGTNYSASTSNTVSQVVNPPATPTSITLAITGNTTTGGPATLSGTVSPSTAAGTVEFFDNNSATPIPIDSGPSTTVSGGAYSATWTAGFAAGQHSVVAVFTPSNPANFESSSSNPPDTFFTAAPAVGICAAAGSSCTDTQNIEGTIPVGTLVINTPYNGTVNALNVGTLALNSNGTAWTGSATFQCIRVTDASSGGIPFVASAQASPLIQTPGSGPATGTTTISGEDVGLTGLGLSTEATCPDGQLPPVQSYNGVVGATNNPAAQPPVGPTDTGTAGLGNAAHTILTGTAGAEGTTTWDGTLTLNAPTSTTSGLYTGTVMFTVTG